MAKRRSHKKRHTSHRRRRIGGVSAIGNTLTELLTITAGAVAATFVVKALPTTLDAKIQAAIPLAVGIALPMFVKSPMVKNIGIGMGVQGTIGLLKSFNVLSGVGSPYALPMIGSNDLNIQTAAPIVSGHKAQQYTY